MVRLTLIIPKGTDRTIECGLNDSSRVLLSAFADVEHEHGHPKRSYPVNVYGMVIPTDDRWLIGHIVEDLQGTRDRTQWQDAKNVLVIQDGSYGCRLCDHDNEGHPEVCSIPRSCIVQSPGDDVLYCISTAVYKITNATCPTYGNCTNCFSIGPLSDICENCVYSGMVGEDSTIDEYRYKVFFYPSIRSAKNRL